MNRGLESSMGGILDFSWGLNDSILELPRYFRLKNPNLELFFWMAIENHPRKIKAEKDLKRFLWRFFLRFSSVWRIFIALFKEMPRFFLALYSNENLHPTLFSIDTHTHWLTPLGSEGVLRVYMKLLNKPQKMFELRHVFRTFTLVYNLHGGSLLT